ncbi:Uncharacterised protein [Legionella busanensis]|uniref:Uncharacterized protein n=1 Tax=Legionella busanensis TaxID=190655 RepID=A0A378JLL4_9GAMM|nr:hypothetical protein [Legionella busanensis]STX52104.1 Uncharacterised protein [Legionella busanensis]
MILKIRNFFSTESIKEKILSGSLSESQLFVYFYLIVMYDALGLTQRCLSMIGRQATPVDLVNIWGYFIITGVGLLILFIANGASKGRNFVSKFFAFSFTVGYKYGIVLTLLDTLSIVGSSAANQILKITIYLIINLLMVANIAFRIYQTR